MAGDRPLCFVLMPFGTKKDPTTQVLINFDAIYEQAIRPALEDAGMEPIRADEERAGGIIHKPMFERLILCDFAIADLTTGNPNVYYELGVRHATRPATTLAIYADNGRLPFDVSFLRCLPYRLGENGQFGDAEASEMLQKLKQRVRELRDLAKQEFVDSPMFQLLTGYRGPDVAHMKTDVFREQVEYSEAIKRELAKARDLGSVESAAAVESKLKDFEVAETGVLVDLYLTWRALGQWDRMIAMYDRLPAALKRSVLVREQYGFALNRAGKRSEAIRVLEAVITENGPSSETYGLLGRIYKDLWMETRKKNEKRVAAGYLDRAIDTYVRGFEADSRDAYPGINAVTLLDIEGGEESIRRRDELLPVVRFAVNQRLRGAKPIYWDYATLLELAVLENNEKEASRRLSDSLAGVREPWEPKTTANNLALIRDVRRERGNAQPWLDEIVEALESRGEVAAAN